MTLAEAQRRLWAAKRVVRECKEKEVLPPSQRAPSLPFGTSERTETLCNQIAEEIEYAEPWASYLAPYVLAVRRARR